MLRYSLVLMAGLWVASSAAAATWADGLFDELSKDFGSVPRGPTREHPFRVVNRTRHAVNISSVRVSCGCVTAFAKKTFLQPGEQTAIIARMDTTRFTGPKSVTIYVQFDRPAFEEVRLWIQANGRNEFTLTPDTLAFGQIKRGGTPSGTVRITFYGNSDARIVSGRGESNYIQSVLREARRAEHEVAYDLTVRLREDTPVGKWYTDVWLRTNIATMPQVRVPLTVEIESPLTVSPPVVLMGTMKVDDETVRRIIVRGVRPFRITQVKGIDGILAAFPGSMEPREVHVLSIRVKSSMAGTLDRTLRVVTDLKDDNEIDFRVQAQVRP